MLRSINPQDEEKPATMSKAEVCQYLGKSKRTIDSYMASGRLAVRFFHGKNGRQSIFDRDNVDRLKAELETPMVRLTPDPSVPSGGRGAWRDQLVPMNEYGERKAAQLAAAPAPGETAALSLNKNGLSSDPFAGLAVHLAALARAYPAPAAEPPRVKPWLTLDEAVAFSGLTARWLLEQAKSDKPLVTVREMGRGARGGRWRFFRGDLVKG
jgi:hypothetical protein